MVKKKKKDNEKTLKNDQEDKTEVQEQNTQPNTIEQTDPPEPNDIKYDVNKASKYLIEVFKDSKEYKKATDEKSVAVMYDKWRKKGEEENKKIKQEKEKT